MDNDYRVKVLIGEETLYSYVTDENIPMITDMSIEEVTTQKNNLALATSAVNRLKMLVSEPKYRSYDGTEVHVFVQKRQETEYTISTEGEETQLYEPETVVDTDDREAIQESVETADMADTASKEIEVRAYYGYSEDVEISKEQILSLYSAMAGTDNMENEGNPLDAVAEDQTVLDETKYTPEEEPDEEISQDDTDTYSEGTMEGINEEDIDSITTDSTETESDGWEPMGVYIVTDVKQTADGDSIMITAYDRMIKLTETYVPDLEEETVTAGTEEGEGDTEDAVVTVPNIDDYFEDLRKQLAERGITLLDCILPEAYLKWNVSCTYREAVAYIAGMVGGIASFNRRGELEITTYDYTSTEIDAYESYVETSDQLALIDAISVDSVGAGYPKDYIKVGNEDASPLYFADPLFSGIVEPIDTDLNAEEILNEYVYKSLGSMKYQPCMITCDWDIAMEPARLIKVIKPEEVTERNRIQLAILDETDDSVISELEDEFKLIGRWACINNITISPIKGKCTITSVGENAEQIQAKAFNTEMDNKILASNERTNATVQEAKDEVMQNVIGTADGVYQLIYNADGEPIGWEIRDAMDRNKYWRFVNGGLYYTDDGGSTFKTAMDTSGNIVATNLVANAVLSNKVTARNLEITGGYIHMETTETTNGSIKINRSEKYAYIEGEEVSVGSGNVSNYENNSYKIALSNADKGISFDRVDNNERRIDMIKTNANGDLLYDNEKVLTENRLGKAITVTEVQVVSSKAIGGGATESGTKAIEKTGYVPIGVIGFRTNYFPVVFSRAYYSINGELVYAIRNTGSVSYTASAWVKVLWMKEDISV